MTPQEVLDPPRVHSRQIATCSLHIPSTLQKPKGYIFHQSNTFLIQSLSLNCSHIPGKPPAVPSLQVERKIDDSHIDKNIVSYCCLTVEELVFILFKGIGFHIILLSMLTSQQNHLSQSHQFLENQLGIFQLATMVIVVQTHYYSTGFLEANIYYVSCTEFNKCCP